MRAHDVPVLKATVPISKVATTLEEMKKLIEQGFEYVTDTQIGITTYKLFRKKKPWQPS